MFFCDRALVKYLFVSDCKIPHQVTTASYQPYLTACKRVAARKARVTVSMGHSLASHLNVSQTFTAWQQEKTGLNLLLGPNPNQFICLCPGLLRFQSIIFGFTTCGRKRPHLWVCRKLASMHSDVRLHDKNDKVSRIEADWAWIANLRECLQAERSKQRYWA